MAEVIVKLKVMPTSPEVNLNALQEDCKAKITEFGAKLHSVAEEPIAFGLKALVFVFLLDESKGGTELLEKKIKENPEVQSAEVVDVRRALG